MIVWTLLLRDAAASGRVCGHHELGREDDFLCGVKGREVCRVEQSRGFLRGNGHMKHVAVKDKHVHFL